MDPPSRKIWWVGSFGASHHKKLKIMEEASDPPKNEIRRKLEGGGGIMTPSLDVSDGIPGGS